MSTNSTNSPVSDVKKVSFSVEGGFITKLARDRLYHDHDMKAAIDLVMGVTVTDELSEEEHLGLAIQILDGKYSLKGTYPNPDYGMVENTPYEPLGFFQELKRLAEKTQQLEEALENERSKTSFLLERMEPWEQSDANEEYMSYYGESLFGDVMIKDTNPILDKMLESFMTRQRNLIARSEDGDDEPDNDYGWIDPQGTFYPAEWGTHDSWADQYLADNNLDTKEMLDFDDEKFHPSRDILIYKLGWILLHSPYQGVAFPTMSPTHTMTKKQKDTLYSYYMDRNLNKEADALWESD